MTSNQTGKYQTTYSFGRAPSEAFSPFAARESLGQWVVEAGGSRKTDRDPIAWE
jgi:hypothetical protein